MKQIIQNYSSGELILREVPVPVVGGGTVLVRNDASLISIGTERSIIELGKQSLLGKARQRPDLVKRFLEKAKTDGLLKTFQEAMGRLDSPTPLGYSSAGTVIEVGAGVHGLSPGDRVACVGAGYASHAEFVRVPQMLCARVPDEVSTEHASFGMLGIIAMHGIRSARLTSGETVAVIGLGLLGLLTVQLLRAYGYQVVGYDLDERKAEQSRMYGAAWAGSDSDRFRAETERLTMGTGADAVIITAATKSDEPVNLGVEIVRFGGRIVLVGVAAIHPSRNEMWHKEVEIVVSKAGGPGSLDPIYENTGIDYPLSLARWTQGRNLSEFLRLIAEGRLDLETLISHRVPLYEVEQTYKQILEGTGGPYVGVVVQYHRDSDFVPAGERTLALETKRVARGGVRVGVIGAGLFANALLLPALYRTPGLVLSMLSTRSGPGVEHAGRKFGFQSVTTDYRTVLSDESIDAVVIVSPHSTHAAITTEALSAGKHVFVEKPMCVTQDELQTLATIVPNSRGHLMVGYNRRFSSHARAVRMWLKDIHQPVSINYRINAGFVPKNHWVHSEKEGRSRIVGEMVHFLDMIRYLSASPIVRVYAERVAGDESTILSDDNIAVTLRTGNGSVATLLYSALGNRSYPRELVEIHAGGSTAVIEDYRTTRIITKRGSRRVNSRGQDMGYPAELQHFVGICRGTAESEMDWESIENTTGTAFAIEESLSTGKAVSL